ncbi:MAG: TIGR00730 family Rossman fold protein [Myxococcota bacterium]
MKSVCVFCGSNFGAKPVYRDAAVRMGRAAAERGLTLVYGGGSVGLMGSVADAALQAGGRVVGVITRVLWDREVGHRGLSDLRIVETMHERKAIMSELADAFVIMPGGIGTMEEFFEVWTWGMLGIHRKPYGLLDIEDYYTPLKGFMDHMVTEGFLRAEVRTAVSVASDPAILLDTLARAVVPPTEKVLDADKV